VDLPAALAERRLLLLSDPALPSAVALLAGGPVRGSWWSHPRGHAFYRALVALEDHADTLAVKLLAGKVTFVHRSLWPALLAVVRARETWQTAGLDGAARALLAEVEAGGALRVEGKASPALRLLERALLVRTASVHGERGAHALEVESWRRWARRVGLGGRKPSAAAGRRVLEVAALGLGAGAAERLPWWRPS
jgi:hypothetical protein